MLIVDTNVWIDHLRHQNGDVLRLLRAERLLLHPYVLGEIALGTFANREMVLKRLGQIPAAPVARPRAVLDLIANQGLHGTGIGYVDAHLIASTRLFPGSRLWTGDKRLHAQAERLGLAHR